LNLVSAGLRAQTKGALDVLEFAHRHRRLTGPSQLLSPLFWLKNGGRQAGSFGKSTEPDLMGAVVDAQEVMSSCDMARAHLAPSLVAQWLHRALPLGRMVQRRRAHYATLAQGLASATGAMPLAQLPDGAAPYVCPLWVQGRERADAVYARMRQAQLPVFRWDRIWPGTPADPQDTGWQWSRELLQLLCHQDLLDDQVATMLQTTRDLLHTS
jgi:perosamine synthetase